MPSAFDAEIAEVLAPDIQTTFAETATFTPRDRTLTAYEINAVWKRPRGERNQDGTVEVDSRRWDIEVLTAELEHTPSQGDRLTRELTDETTKTYRLVSDVVAPHAEDGDGGGVFTLLHALEVET